MISSCAKAPSTKQSFTLKIGALQTGIALNGGVYVRAISAKSDSIVKLDANDSAVFEFGKWEFQVIGFAGPGPFQGIKYCGRVQEFEVGVANTNLEMVLTAASCLSEPFITLLNDVESKIKYATPFTVQSIVPNTGALAGGTNVTIRGSSFYPGATVALGSSDCASVTVVNSSTITCTTGFHTAGVTNLTVTNDDGRTASFLNAYTYVPAPTVSSVTANTGGVNGGAAVTVSGTGFLSGATPSFGGVACTGVTVLNPTTITCTTPAHAAGAVNVVVTNTDLQSGTLISGFTFIAPPAAPSSLSLFSPAVSPAVVSTPAITVSGVNSGHTIKLYKDSTCSSEVASGVASGTTINLTSSALAFGFYSFYAKAIDSFSQSSLCSSAFVNYAYYSFITVPQNLSGYTSIGSNDVRKVFVDSSGTIYASTANGLSISNDGGATFSTKTTIHGLGENSVYGAFVDSSGKVYASTFLGGVGISSDGGLSFNNKVPNGGTNLGVYVDSAAKIYAVTNTGLAISSDAGTTFSTKTTVQGLGSNGIQGVFVDSSNVIYAATIGGLSISLDGGASFTNKTTADGLGSNSVYDVYVDSFGTIYAATIGGLSISVDGGISFSNKTTAQGLGNNVVHGVTVDGSGTIYAATSGGLSISSNGGASFINKTTSQGLGSNTVQGVFVRAGGNVYAATANGLSISTDGGSTFTNRSTSSALKHNGAYVVKADSSSGKIYVGTASGLFSSSNGGATFSPTADTGLVSTLSIDSSGIIYSASSGGGVRISTDGGVSFTTKTTAQGLGSNSVSSVFAKAGGKIYAATSNGLSISTNGGTSFTNKTTADGLGSNTVNGVYVDSGNVIYAATSNGLSVSTDGGISFANKTTVNGLGANSVTGVYVDLSGKVYAACSNGVSISSDGAASFSHKVAASLTSTQGVFVDGHGVIYAYDGSFEHGLSMSTNGGASFVNYSTAQGLGGKRVYGVDVDSSGKVYVATYGGGVQATAIP